MSNEGGLALVRKSVELLDLLASRGEATAAQIADTLNEPRSSVYRLLSSLQSLDMVETGTRRGMFRLGFRLLTLGTAVVNQFDERHFARPVMERLHDETGETIFLCVSRGDVAVCIERLAGRRVQSLALNLGGSLPLHSGAAPRVLLAFQDPANWQGYLDRNAPLRRFTPTTPVDSDTLLPLLEQTRRTGFNVSDQDVTIGVAAIGVPIVDYRGQIRAALSISGLRDAILGAEREHLSNRLREAGEEISRALGSQLAGTAVVDFG